MYEENFRIYGVRKVWRQLGRGPHDLFGADRDRPLARIDKAGLLWLLNGHRIVALTEYSATIETETGARQTYRRKLGEPAACSRGSWHHDFRLSGQVRLVRSGFPAAPRRGK